MSLFNLLVKTKLWRRKDERLASAFDLAMSNNTSLSYEDAIKFFDSDTTPTASTPAHTISSVKGGWAVAATFFPPEHGIVQTFRTFCNWWDSNPLLIQETWEAFHEPLYFPTAVLFYLHKELSTWINLQINSATVVPAPDFMEWVLKVMKKDNWYRGLPAGSLPLYTTPVGGATSLVSDLTNQAGTGSHLPSLGAVPGSNSIANTPTSGGTGATGASNPQDSQRKHFQAASAAQAEFIPFKTSKKSYREAMSSGARNNDPIPVDRNGTAYCLGWHIRGECWQNCKRNEKKGEPKFKSNHRPLDAAEITTLIPWCTKWVGTT